MAQSLATELGPRGIRVNTVAPGHIWGDSLKWYFGYLAHKRGAGVQQLYDETAAGTDLGRLPEPGEVADAVVFWPHRWPGRSPGSAWTSTAASTTIERGAMKTIGTVADLHGSASRVTGLADFGPDDYTDGLSVLLESYSRDAELTPTGERATRALLRGALVARLLSEAGWQPRPAWAEARVLVIQTHRAPWAAIASVCSLAAQATDGWSARFRGPVIGHDQLSLWAFGLERFTAERARHDPARFYDVAYDDFVADPFGTVEAAYGYFGLPTPGLR
jgi:Sulfotransferase family/Enoyl-(Acyl carrier protein) reductase